MFDVTEMTIPCTGKFYVHVEGDDWKVVVAHNSGIVYECRGNSLDEQPRAMIDINSRTMYEFEPFMWEGIRERITLMQARQRGATIVNEIPNGVQ